MACVEVQASFKSGSLGVYVVFSRLSIGRVYQRDIVSKFGPNPRPRRRDSETRIDFYTATGHAVLVDHLVHFGAQLEDAVQVQRDFFLEGDLAHTSLRALDDADRRD